MKIVGAARLARFVGKPLGQSVGIDKTNTFQLSFLF